MLAVPRAPHTEELRKHRAAGGTGTIPQAVFKGYFKNMASTWKKIGNSFHKKGFVLSVRVKIFMVSAVSFQICHGPLNIHLDIASFNYWNA